jgi:glycosyltransferase involved in cell wall biosynthesis
MNQPCTIVIPCYNEEKRFPLERFAAYAAAHDGIRFLLVNDGSKDHTLAVLRRAREGREDRVDILDQPANGGKGEAVRCGMLAAMERSGCLYAGFWDADLATPLESIEELEEVLRERPEVAMVFGARVKLLGLACGAQGEPPLSGARICHGGFNPVAAGDLTTPSAEQNSSG